MNVRFKIACKKEDAKFIFELKDSLKEDISDNVSFSCIHIALPPDLIKELVKRKRFTEKIKLKIIEELPSNDTKVLKKYLKRIRDRWKRVEGDFFKEIQKIFGFRRRRFICYITKNVCGMYLNKNKIVLPYYKLKENEIIYVIAEELLHIYYWDYMKKLKYKIKDPWEIKGKKWNCWHISEIIPEYLLVNNPTFFKYGWNKIKRERGYPWIPAIKNISDPIWKKSESFREFIIKLHEKCGIKLD